MSVSRARLPVELEQIILDNSYEQWHLCAGEANFTDGIQLLAPQPYEPYEISPLLTSGAWREYSIELLNRNFQGLLAVTAADGGSDDPESQKDIVTAKPPLRLALTSTFKHMYHRVTTLRFEKSSVLLAALPLLRPELPNLELIELFHQTNYHVTKLDLSAPKTGASVNEIVCTSLWDQWLITWIKITWHCFYSDPVSHAVCGFNMHFGKSFSIERMGNERLFVVFDVTTAPFRIVSKRKL